jgi:hypothetical protein
MLIRMPNPDNRDTVPSRSADQGPDIRDDSVALMSTLHYASLRVNYKKCSGMSVAERRHMSIMVAQTADFRP